MLDDMTKEDWQEYILLELVDQLEKEDLYPEDIAELLRKDT